MEIEIAVGQLKPRKADYDANLEAVGEIFAVLETEAKPVDLLVLPETALSGYFLEGGVRDVARSATSLHSDLLATFRSRVCRPDAVLDIAVGFYEIADSQYYNSGLYATLTASDDTVARPGIVHVHRKFFLPTYGVFDEKRFVSRGRRIEAFDTRLGRTAVLICEDAWHSVSGTLAALQGAQLLVVLSASPGREFGGKAIGNLERWDVLLRGMAEEHGVFVAYAGLVGFEGGKGFTGSSRVVDPWGRTLIRGPVSQECLVRARLDLDDVAVARGATPLLSDLESAVGDIAAHFHRAASVPSGPGWEPRL